MAVAHFGGASFVDLELKLFHPLLYHFPILPPTQMIYFYFFSKQFLHSISQLEISFQIHHKFSLPLPFPP